MTKGAWEYNGVKIASLTNGVGGDWTGKPKIETRPSTYTIYQNKLKMNKRLKYKLWYHKNPGENIGSKISDISHNNIFADISPRQGKQRENKQRGQHQIKTLLHT